MKPEIQGLGIVLLGSFNPKIFQPAWFAANNLLSETEADEVQPEIIHSDITIFSLEWMKMEVTRERFNAFTWQEPYFEVLADLVVGTFNLLEHTPVGKLGINPSMHYRLKSEDEWNKVGDNLAPKTYWDKMLENSGMQRLEIVETRKEGPLGHLRVSVEPSKKCHPGVYFTFNDHYEIDDPSKALNCLEISGILSANWQDTYNRGIKISSDLLTQILES